MNQQKSTIDVQSSLEAVFGDFKAGIEAKERLQRTVDGVYMKIKVAGCPVALFHLGGPAFAVHYENSRAYRDAVRYRTGELIAHYAPGVDKETVQEDIEFVINGGGE